MNPTVFGWVAVGAGVCFLAYLLYTRQFKWLYGVIRNVLLGCAGILGFNYLLASTGLVVGINALTAFVVGVLGLPGFMLLYVTRLIIGVSN